MTNLLIAFPHVQEAALTVDTYTTAPGVDTPDDLYIAPVENLWSKKRATEWWGAFSRTDHHVEWDLGVGGELSCNFIALARMDRMCGTPKVNYYLEGKADEADPWTTVDSHVSANGMNDLPRYGTQLTDDYMKTFTASTAYRYWRVHFDSVDGNNFSARLSKLYFGTILDLGVEPVRWECRPVIDREGMLLTSSGATRLVRSSQPKLQVDLTWEGVTDTALQNFERHIILKRERNSFFLYTATFHDVLRGFRQLHVNLDNYTTESRKLNFNSVTCKFVEVLG